MLNLLFLVGLFLRFITRRLFPGSSMVKLLAPGSNDPDSEEVETDGEEEIICTHLNILNPEASTTTGAESPGPRPNNNGSGNGSNFANDAAYAAAAAGTAGVAVPTIATAGLTAVGFTSSGVAAGSMAAGLQAGIGNVAAGSAFAACQSIGATGGFAILGPVGLGAAAVAGCTYLGVRTWRNWRSGRQEEEQARRRQEDDAAHRRQEDDAARRRQEEEDQAKKKLNEDKPDGGSGETVKRPMCPECTKKLLLRLTKEMCRNVKVT